MEALTACAVAALTVYDMVKALERGVTLERIELIEKSGGRHDWQRSELERRARRRHARRSSRSAPRAPPARAPTSAASASARSRAASGSGSAGSDLIADEQALIEARLRFWSDVERCGLILTTGGTGVSPSDVTPEATRAVMEREVPGIAEAMRLASRAHTPNWMLSRAVAGLRGVSLIINFPGSPASIDQTGEAIAAAIAHALSLVSGESSGH